MVDLIMAWSLYFDGLEHWTDLVKNIHPIATACGLIYELPNTLERPDESLAIVDMRSLAFTQPHYHPETEVYFVLQGRGLIVIGNQQQVLQEGSVVTIPSNIAHFVIPLHDLVIGVINTPPFNRENYHPLTQSDVAVQFDRTQFETFINHYSVYKANIFS